MKRRTRGEGTSEKKKSKQGESAAVPKRIKKDESSAGASNFVRATDVGVFLSGDVEPDPRVDTTVEATETATLCQPCAPEEELGLKTLEEMLGLGYCCDCSKRRGFRCNLGWRAALWSMFSTQSERGHCA